MFLKLINTFVPPFKIKCQVNKMHFPKCFILCQINNSQIKLKYSIVVFLEFS